MGTQSLEANIMAVVDTLLQVVAKGGTQSMRTSNLVQLVTEGIATLDAVGGLTGEQKRTVLLSALRRLAELAASTGLPGPEAVLIDALIESPLLGDVVDALCAAAAKLVEKTQPRWCFW